MTKRKKAVRKTKKKYEKNKIPENISFEEIQQNMKERVSKIKK